MLISSEFSYNITGTASSQFPTLTFFALLDYNTDDVLEIQKEYPFRKGWGIPQSTHLYEREFYPMPHSIDMIYLSIVEGKFYSLEAMLPSQQMEKLWENAKQNGLPYKNMIVGMAPYGGVAFWAHGEKKSTRLAWLFGEEVVVNMSDFMPTRQDVTLKEVCDFYINSDPRVRENLEKNGLPPQDLFDNYMKQFTYRYQVQFGHWDEKKKEWSSDEGTSQTEASPNTDHPTPEFDYIEEALFDGTHDKLHDGGLMNYHEAGKPKKLAVQWHIKKSEYTAYFWFEDELICNIFNRFYGAHPETKTDFMIRINAENNKYELALYRYGLKEPQIISESAYQLLVFKSKFECFRSKNYNQPRGAWIW
jgi:hypothetical protein